MNFPRPKSLNELILVGFGLVALPLLIAVLWGVSSLDRLATQSEELVFTGVSTAENNRLLTENLGSLERVARQYVILRNPDSLQLLRQDLATLENRLEEMRALAEMASARTALASIGDSARFIVNALDKDDLSTDDAQGVASSVSRGDELLLLEPLDQLMGTMSAQLQGPAETVEGAGFLAVFAVMQMLEGVLVLHALGGT